MNDSFYFEMDELHEILEETTDEEEFLETMMDLLGFNDPKYGVFMEKKETIKYRIKSFKKRYDFHKTNPEGTIGAILINGIPVCVDLDINNYDTEDYERDASAVYLDEVQQYILVLNRSFFELNKKDQDALIQHEMGHMRLKPGNPSRQTANDRITDKLIVKWIQKLSDKVDSMCELEGMTDEERDDVIEDLQDAMKEHIETLYNAKRTSPDMEKLRDEMYDYAEKYVQKLSKKYKFSVKGKGILQSIHFDADEMEADRYAANHTSEKQVTRAIINYNKQQARTHNKSKMRKTTNQIRKDEKRPPISDKEFNEEISRNNKEHDADFIMRKKALNDDKMKHSKVYKNI